MKYKKSPCPCYCINLRRAAGCVSSIYDSHLAEVDLTVNQYSLLRNIQQMVSCTAGELAEQVGLERTTIVRMLKPLTERELIGDTEAESRSRRFQLTEAGEALLERSLPLWRSAQTEIEDRIGKEELKTLISIFDRLEVS